MSNPDPEVHPDLVKQHRPDAIMATGRSDFPNQVNNVLCFPFLFRGALDVGATTITREMEKACVFALANLALSESNEKVAQYYKNETMQFGPDYILPKPFDPRLITTIAPAVAQAAIDSGVATRPFNNIETYRKSLEPLVYRSGNVMRPVFEKAQSYANRVVYTDGENERVLRAVQDVVDQRYAHPLLIGNAEKIQKTIKQLNLRLVEGENYKVVRAIADSTVERIRQACDMVANCQADAVLSGPGALLHEQTKAIEDNLGVNNEMQRLAVMHLLLLDKGSYFIADTSIHENPSAEQLARISLYAAEQLRVFGIQPRVALLSHSNFGNHQTESSLKMAKVKQLLQNSHPELEVDGEMRGGIALNQRLREREGHSDLTGDANLLILPNLDAANITYTVLKSLGNGIPVGPIVLGTRIPIHAITRSTTPRGIVNLTSLVAASVKRSQ
jgi:malate dehydrogenase (oxaloacetate-decarboxylating)(NADP+)